MVSGRGLVGSGFGGSGSTLGLGFSPGLGGTPTVVSASDSHISRLILSSMLILTL